MWPWEGKYRKIGQEGKARRYKCQEGKAIFYVGLFNEIKKV
jgi:hypothetical protein